MQERCKIGVVIGNANSPHAVKIMKGIDQASKECNVQLMYFMNVSSPYTAQLYPPDTSIGWDYQKSAIQSRCLNYDIWHDEHFYEE